MRIHRTLILIAAVVSLAGCRSGGGAGWASWNPFSKSKDTAVANAAPELPSKQVAASGAAPAATAKTSVASAAPASGATSSAPAYTPPAAVARTAAATTTTPSTVASSASPYSAPVTTSEMPSAPMNTSLASGEGVKPTGPYNPNGYQPAATPAATESTAGVNRYGMPDRYASATAAGVPATSAPAETPVFTAAPSQPSGDRYATYETTVNSAMPSSTAPATTNPTVEMPTTQPVVSTASATVNLPAAPGQYRPAGTATYQATNPEQVNVASLPEKPTGTTPATTAPVTTPSGYPSTGAPAPGSIYGVPSYR